MKHMKRRWYRFLAATARTLVVSSSHSGSGALRVPPRPVGGNMRASRPSVFALLLTILLTSAPLVEAAPPSPTSVRAEATKLYRAGKYAAACAKFREAAKLAPDDPAIAADVGLCLMKMNDTEKAIEETYHAIRLARPGGPRDDAKTRRNAYYNLRLLNVSIAVPKQGVCGPIEPASGCDRPLYACSYRLSSAGTQEGEDLDYASVALTLEKAKPPCSGNVLDCEGTPGNANGSVEAPGAAPSAPEERGDLLLSSREWMTGAAAEKAEGRMPEEWTCSVVAADACLGIAATVCEGSGGYTSNKAPRRDIIEVLLAVPRK